ncbi:MAG: hypothetical protein CFE31_09870 [Rhizobiales bacterium PAR1]|nr:MAG: hypothetical protein CFE31_09870 [Rhizobiales bacterium PAR1]
METRILRVSKGVSVFRYVSSQGGPNAPEVMVSAPAGSGLDIITVDRSANPVLRAPGDGVVVRAEYDTSLMVTIMPSASAGSRDAHFVFEQVTQSPSGSFAPAKPPFRTEALTQPVSIPSVLAHIARRGDVLVPPGEWVCGPQLPMVIEGLQISWPDRPQGVDLVVGCVINAGGRRTVPAAMTGTFVGTRGKAAPIVGLTLSLSGPRATAYRLSCEALFFGSQVQIQEGQALEFSGSTGFEPLVGLRISVSTASAMPMRERPVATPFAEPRFATPIPAPRVPEPAPVEQVPMVVAPSEAFTPTNKAGRVRVFRTSKPSSLSQSLN